MRPLLLAPLLFFPFLRGQERLHEKGSMNLVTKKAWVSILGGWGEGGRPVIKDMSFMTRWNPNLLSQELGAPYRIEFRSATGRTKERGLTILESSDGKNSRLWSAHCGNAFGKPDPEEPFASFRIKGPGQKWVDGKLEWVGPGEPALHLWEGEGSKLRWEVKEAWFVQVDVSINDGENWKLLGEGNTGSSDLSPYIGKDPVVRIQAFRGLRCYVDVFIPGQGILSEPRRYLAPTFLQEPLPHQGANRSAQLSAWPKFVFEVSVNGQLPSNFITKVKRHLNWKRLPFDLDDLFPDKYVQDVMQAEFKPQPDAAKYPQIRYEIDPIMLRDPIKAKKGNLKLFRVSRELEKWKVEFMFDVFQAKYASEAQASEENEFSGTQKSRTNAFAPRVDFESYFVLVGEP